MPSSSFARFTPSHAAELKDLSSFPPMSKTMPTRSFPPDSSRLPRTLVQAGNVIPTTKIKSSRFRFFILLLGIIVLSLSVSSMDNLCLNFNLMHRLIRNDADQIDDMKD